MTQPRLAFAAAHWGDSAVVCRAEENSPGPVVEQQFGIFPTWNQANAFARKLNEGLEVTPEDARQVVTSAMLAASGVVRAPEPKDTIWKRAPVLVAAERLQWHHLLAQLDLAITFCDLSRGRLADSRYRRLLETAQRTVDVTLGFVRHNKRNRREILQVCAKLETLGHRLRKLPHEYAGL